MTHSSLATRTRWNKLHRRTRNGASVQYFIVHHTAGTNDDAMEDVVAGNRRVSSAHYVIRNDGEIVAVVDENYRALSVASATWDGKAITVEVVNSSGAPSWNISAKAFESLAKLIEDVSRRYGFPLNRDRVIGHNEVYTRFRAGYATACPGGINMKALVARAQAIRGGSPTTPSTPSGGSTSPSKPSTGSIGTKLGTAYVKTLQGQLGTVQDGNFGSVSIKLLQKRIGTVQDGNFGAVSVKKLQAFVGTVQDGNWGSVTTSKVKAAIDSGKFRSGSTSPSTGSKVVVDGILGKQTIKALQRQLGQVQDGNFGPVTKKALQRQLGQVQDGSFGPVSVKALQRKLGVVVDGNWGAQTTRALQNRLNAGTF